LISGVLSYRRDRLRSCGRELLLAGSMTWAPGAATLGLGAPADKLMIHATE